MRVYYETSVTYFTNSSVSTVAVYSAWSDVKMMPLVHLCVSDLPQTTSSGASDIFFTTPNTDITTPSHLLSHSTQSKVFDATLTYSLYPLPSNTYSSFPIVLTSSTHLRTGLANWIFMYITFITCKT